MGTKEQRRAKVASEVRAEMARQQVTVTALSKSTNINAPTLRRRLDGQSPFYVEELAAICAALNVGLSTFIDRTEVAA